MRQTYMVLAFTAVLAIGSRPGPAEHTDTPPPPIYLDVTNASGLNVPHYSGYEVTGQAWGDVDNDGWLDVYVTDGGGANHLYRNYGNGTFVKHDLSDSVALAGIGSGGACP